MQEKSTSPAGRRNALAAETSPYLLQHASNPVEWYPWGEAALALAKGSGKPILLSIGYSACHWCHVMAHESFEDDETAALMNALFVNVKVDREERPDLDRIYQTAQQLLNRRHGGWPLTMFLTHDDQVPFAGGTYFPKEARWGMPAFKSVLRHIAEVYHDRLNDIRQQNAAVLEALLHLQAPGTSGEVELNSAPLLAARGQLEQMYDEPFGGFGKAPKFPHPTMIDRLLRHHAASERVGTPDERALEMAAHTLRSMAEGGIYDHLGGGFSRYSTDAEWTIPHFEKMLYDNGPLLALYAEAWQITGEELFARTATETGEWLIRDMQSPTGGYYSSLDADSEGQEGRFYVWHRDEIRASLTADEYRCFAARYGLDQPPNFEGAWHLRVTAGIAEIATDQRTDAGDVAASIGRARRKLLALRNRRIWPGRDEKILGSWNALAIRGMAIAGRILGRRDFLQSAERAMDFVRDNLQAAGRLLATWKDGRGHLRAYLDDHAFLIEASLALLQARWRRADLDFAIALAKSLLQAFEDTQSGGFFFTAHDHERLIQRLRTFGDDAMPAGNGVAAFALTRLGELLGEERYLRAAERTIAAGWDASLREPTAHLALLRAVEERLHPTEIVVVRADGPALEEWSAAAQRHYLPTRMVFAIPTVETSLPALLAARTAASAPIAYVCSGTHCRAPVHHIDDLNRPPA